MKIHANTGAPADSQNAKPDSISWLLVHAAEFLLGRSPSGTSSNLIANNTPTMLATYGASF